MADIKEEVKNAADSVDKGVNVIANKFNLTTTIVYIILGMIAAVILNKLGII